MAESGTHGSQGTKGKYRRAFNFALAHLIAVGVCLSGSLGNVHAANAGGQDGSAPARVQTSRFRPEVLMQFDAGYRRDDLDWNIAGDAGGNNPNVLSELTWDDLESWQVKFSSSLIFPNIVALRGYADYGWIFDGKNQDSDYLGDNRTFEFSRSNNKADNGVVWDASLAVGYPFQWNQAVIATFIPLVGYSRHEQNLKITDGDQTIPDSGPFPGLHSSYDTEWKGPFLGIDMRFKAGKPSNFAERLETYFSYEYHWADYHAKANWNLRDDLQHPKSFEHKADGTGWIIGAGLNVILQRHLALNFDVDYQNWSTEAGNDKVFLANGTTAKTRLNEVNWSTYALSLGLQVSF